MSDRRNHDVQLEQMPASEQFSDSEVQLLDEIWAEHGAKDTGNASFRATPAGG